MLKYLFYTFAFEKQFICIQILLYCLLAFSDMQKSGISFDSYFFVGDFLFALKAFRIFSLSFLLFSLSSSSFKSSSSPHSEISLIFA